MQVFSCIIFFSSCTHRSDYYQKDVNDFLTIRKENLDKCEQVKEGIKKVQQDRYRSVKSLDKNAIKQMNYRYTLLPLEVDLSYIFYRYCKSVKRFNRRKFVNTHNEALRKIKKSCIKTDEYLLEVVRVIINSDDKKVVEKFKKELVNVTNMSMSVGYFDNIIIAYNELAQRDIIDAKKFYDLEKKYRDLIEYVGSSEFEKRIFKSLGYNKKAYSTYLFCNSAVKQNPNFIESELEIIKKSLVDLMLL
jgi:hypothetical protein